MDAQPSSPTRGPDGCILAEFSPAQALLAVLHTAKEWSTMRLPAQRQLAARVARPQHDSRSAHVSRGLAFDGVEARGHRRLPQCRRAFIYSSVAPDADGQQRVVVAVR